MSPFSYALLTLVAGFSSVSGKSPDLSDRVVHAVNCGGQQHLGAYGIVYQEDRHPVGIVSDYGSRYAFRNAPLEDRKLYETERYHNGELAYVFDIAKDGDYVIVLKFSEVYFTSPGEKIFHVHVNDIAVKKNLDIYRETRAPGFAYDMYIDVSIRKKEIVIGEMIGDIDKELQIRFVPVADNPKINAIAILTGSSSTLPSRPPPAEEPRKETSRRRSREEMLESSDDEVEDEPYDEPIVSSGHELASGPPAHNPFEDKNDNVFVYLGVTLVCLLPVVAFIMHM
ncbi:hypothetical protein Q1695_015843 [Nippostrongylus brasiliensis]|nr:hypothetical protein Q1695_015843 [Nippostrongylus brasiliensis]